MSLRQVIRIISSITAASAVAVAAAVADSAGHEIWSIILG
jgi:hypothetical protein